MAVFQNRVVPLRYRVRDGTDAPPAAPLAAGYTPCGNKKERGGSNPALSAIYFSVSHRSSNANGGQARARTETKMYHQNEFIVTYPFTITILRVVSRYPANGSSITTAVPSLSAAVVPVRASHSRRVHSRSRHAPISRCWTSKRRFLLRDIRYPCPPLSKTSRYSISSIISAICPFPTSHRLSIRILM